jgi:hypothetical protein
VAWWCGGRQGRAGDPSGKPTQRRISRRLSAEIDFLAAVRVADATGPNFFAAGLTSHNYGPNIRPSCPWLPPQSGGGRTWRTA